MSSHERTELFRQLLGALVMEKIGRLKRLAIVPGNGCTPIRDCNWYLWLAESVKQRHPTLEVILKDMPDPYRAARNVWLPFMKKELKVDHETIVVGHSSGAAAILRYLEQDPIGVAILVSAYTTDLGDSNERASGYFTGPFLWDKMKRNSTTIIQFTSKTDPFLPMEEQLEVVMNTDAIHHNFEDRGHFMDQEFPELLEVILKLLE